MLADAVTQYTGFVQTLITDPDGVPSIVSP